MPMWSNLVIYLSDYICPRCGKKTVYRPELHGLCEECYLEVYGKKVSIKRGTPSIEIKRCRICGKVKMGNNWIKPSRRNLEKLFLSQIKKEHRYLKSGDNLFILEFDNQVMDVPREVTLNVVDRKTNRKIKTLTFIVKVNYAVCDLCQLKQVGEYFEYIIRLRTTGGNSLLESELRGVFDELDVPIEDYIKITRVKGGLDIYFTNRKVGEKVAKRIIARRGLSYKKFYQRKYFKTLEKSVLIENVVINI